MTPCGLIYPYVKIRIMQTRSQTRSQAIGMWVPTELAVYEVDIDFDEASRMWEYNKKRIGSGSYKYICCVLNKSGVKCSRQVVGDTKYCRGHNKTMPASSLN
jgi:hypothetical protein